MTLKFLDCFCGMGGASEGFHIEGFECSGIDIINVGYPYTFIQADMLNISGKDFRDYEVIWGSPPCRDFSPLAIFLGHRWKRKPSPKDGLKLVNSFLQFVREAKPKIWIMENVPRLEYFLQRKPKQISYIGRTMRRAFWGNYPAFLMPTSSKEIWFYDRKAGRTHEKYKGKMRSWERAKIPLPCSLAFAHACKEKLTNA